jgi:Zn-dependent protease with chaperone function
MDLKQKIKLNFLCSLGYIYFSAILVSVIAIISFTVLLVLAIGRLAAVRLLIKLAIPLLILSWKFIKGFSRVIFTKLPEPDGTKLSKKEYPNFYKFIDDIRRQAQCPKIHYIKLNFDFNAYIAEQPTLGLIGLYRRYLVIGLPLLLALEQDELKAVLAHECGHLSKAHGRSGIKIYRIKLIWEGIVKELKKDKKDKSFFVRIFIHRYIPALNDMLFSMKKEHEYQADSIAVSVVNKETMADALLKLHIYDAHLQQSFWPEIYKMNAENTLPPEDLYYRMEEVIRTPIQENLLKPLIEGFLKYRSLPNSTHPSYIERVERLGIDIPSFKFTKCNSLRTIFKNQADSVLNILNKVWAEDVKEGWKDYFNKVENMKNRLQYLQERYKNNLLEEEEIIERAELIEILEGKEKGFEAFKEAKEKQPESNYIDYNIGRLLLFYGKEEGVDLLKQVMETDYQMIPLCCYELVNYFYYKNKKETAAEYYHYAVRFMETNEDVKKERNIVRFSDTYIPHDLSYDTIKTLQTALLKYKEIRKAYVVRKHLEMSGQFPLYIIGIKYRTGISRSKRLSIQNQIAKEGLLLWNSWWVYLNGRNKEFEYIINSIPESRIL